MYLKGADAADLINELTELLKPYQSTEAPTPSIPDSTTASKPNTTTAYIICNGKILGADFIHMNQICPYSELSINRQPLNLYFFEDNYTLS